jgi:hypothetical protein
MSVRVLQMQNRIGIAIAIVLTITTTTTVLPLAYASSTSPYDSGYNHGCDDAGLSASDRYMTEPRKGPSFHTDEFMSGYRDGFQECGGGSSGDGGGGGSLEDVIRDACVVF